jgi:hypothetical protein
MTCIANIVTGITVVVLMLLLCIGFARSEPVCMSADMRERVRVLMLDGIDQAFKAHAGHMFEVWQRDPTKQPQRANTGMKSGITAYIGARAAAQRWSPPLCQ